MSEQKSMKPSARNAYKKTDIKKHVAERKNKFLLSSQKSFTCLLKNFDCFKSVCRAFQAFAL